MTDLYENISVKNWTYCKNRGKGVGKLQLRKINARNSLPNFNLKTELGSALEMMN